MSIWSISLASLQCCPGFWNLSLFYIICDEIKSVLMRKMRIYFLVIVRTKIYENKKALSKKFSSHGVLSLTLKTALSSQPDFYWNPHPANLNFMSSLFTTLCYYYFFSLSGMLKSSSFSLLYPTNWKTETEKSLTVVNTIFWKPFRTDLLLEFIQSSDIFLW